LKIREDRQKNVI